MYLANELADRGYSVDLVLMRVQGELLGQVDARVRIVDLRAARIRNVFLPLMNYVRREKPLGFVAHMWPLTLMATLAVRFVMVDTRLIVVEHNNWTRQSLADSILLRFVRKLSMRLCFPWADNIVGVSNGVASDLEQYAWLRKGNVLCVHNPVTGLARPGSSVVAPGFADEWLYGAHKRVIAVGTLKAQKNFNVLLDAFHQLATHADARLLILGEGSERAALESQVQALGLQHRVSMPGFTDTPSTLLRKADLFVLSSDYEGLPTVLIEALEQGTAVVSTDCPSGPREILDNGRYGTLVAVGDPDALATAMLQSLQATHDHDALRARARDFSVDKAADAYLDLLLPGWRSNTTP